MVKHKSNKTSTVSLCRRLEYGDNKSKKSYVNSADTVFLDCKIHYSKNINYPID